MATIDYPEPRLINALNLPEHNVKFREALNIMRRHQKLTDVTIMCRNSSFPCHKVVLAARSRFFKNLFKTEESMETIVLDDVTPHAIEILIDYMYTDCLPSHELLDLNSYSELLRVAEKLNLNDITICWMRTIEHNLNPKNFAQVWDTAETMNNNELMESVVNFVVSNLDKLWITVDFLKQPYDRLKIVLKRASVQLSCHDNLVRVVLAWVKQNKEERLPLFLELLQHVTYDSVSDIYARFVLDHESLVVEVPMFKTQIQQSLQFRNQKLTTGEVQNITDRTSPSIPLAPSQTSTRTTQSSSCVSPKRTARSVRSTASTPINPPLSPSVSSLSTDDITKVSNIGLQNNLPKEPSLANLDSASLVIVGHAQATGSACLLNLDLRDGQWSNIEDTNLKMANKQSVACGNGMVTLIGGEDSHGGKLGQSFAYCLNTFKTIRLPHLRLPRSGAGSVIWQGEVFVLGGSGRCSPSLSQVERLELDNPNLWKNCAPLHFKRNENLAICSCADGIIITGGGSNKCEKFDTTDRKWYQMQDLPEEVASSDVLLVSTKSMLAAIIPRRPSKILVLPLNHRDCQWREMPTQYAPEQVVSAAGFRGTEGFLALDKNSNLYELLLDRKDYVWNALARIPKVFPSPQYIFITELKEPYYSDS